MPSSPTLAAAVRARRLGCLIGAVVVVATGLTVHLVGSGPVADVVGDVLYAVLIYLVIAVAFPRARVWVVGASAAAVCAAVELFQLTGLPGQWAESFWPIRLVLGVGFDARDLVAYVAGAAAAAGGDLALHALARRRTRR